jgi:outer membrane biosynthesis protein TonB
VCGPVGFGYTSREGTPPGTTAMPLPSPVEPPPVWPAARRSRRGTYLFKTIYVGMLIAGLAVGFVAGRPKPTPPARPTLVAATKLDPIPPVQAPPEPKAKAPEPRPVESKTAEPKEPEPEPKPKSEPPPEKKPEPKPEPKKAEPPPKASGPEMAFAKVAPVFKEKCTTCHGGVEPKGGLDLRSAKAAIAGGDSGAGVQPGDPDNSLIWQSIRAGTMPPKNKPQLTADEKKLIREWIAGGAK